VTVSPAFDPDKGVWFIEGCKFEATTLAALQKLLPKNTKIAGYYPKGYNVRPNFPPGPANRIPVIGTRIITHFKKQEVQAPLSAPPESSLSPAPSLAPPGLLPRNTSPEAAERALLEPAPPKPKKKRYSVPLKPEPWTEEDKEKLKALIRMKKSPAQCVEHFPGRTRNAIIGRAYRMKLRWV